MNVTRFDYPVCYDHMSRHDLSAYARGLEAYCKEREAQVERDATAVDAVRKLGEALAHLNDGYYSLSEATKEVEDAEKLLSDVSERVYYAALAAQDGGQHCSGCDNKPYPDCQGDAGPWCAGFIVETKC